MIGIKATWPFIVAAPHPPFGHPLPIAKSDGERGNRRFPLQISHKSTGLDTQSPHCALPNPRTQPKWAGTVVRVVRPDLRVQGCVVHTSGSFPDGRHGRREQARRVSNYLAPHSQYLRPSKIRCVEIAWSRPVRDACAHARASVSEGTGAVAGHCACCFLQCNRNQTHLGDK
jgi:hypothetical protein